MSHNVFFILELDSLVHNIFILEVDSWGHNVFFILELDSLVHDIFFTLGVFLSFLNVLLVCWNAVGFFEIINFLSEFA